MKVLVIALLTCSHEIATWSRYSFRQKRAIWSLKIVLASIFHVFSLFCGIHRNLIHFRESSEMPVTLKSQIRALKSQELDLYLAIVENLADFVNAVNWLPPGYLWSGKFSPKFSGGMGVISSVIKLYRLHSSKPKVA